MASALNPSSLSRGIYIGLSGIGALLLLLALRVPVGFALFSVAMIGIGAASGPQIAINLVRIEPFHFAAHWSFSAIPMFIFMGCIAQHTRLAETILRYVCIFYSNNHNWC